MITPYTSKQIPWWIAKAIKASVVPTLSVLEFWNVFFNTWSEVYAPSGKDL